MRGLVLLLLVSGPVSAQSSLMERGLAELWAAEDEAGRRSASEKIVRGGGDFYAVYARLRSGRRYVAEVATGLLEESRRGTDGRRYEYVFLVPEDYDPALRYRVCFYLHGGIGRPDPWEKGEDWWRRFDRFDAVPQISVFPSSWRASPWWQASQIENLEAILNRIKRDYNVDENRVYLYGVSDGGTGVFYHAFKAPTPWAAFFAFLGHPSVLQNPATQADGEIFPDSLATAAIYVVNGERDRLYPADQVRAFVETYRVAGAEIVFQAMPGGHNTRWWNGARDVFQAFMDEHPRDPYPDRLVWRTESPERFPRNRWVVVETLAPGVASGRIEVAREGNVFTASTEGVGRYRLLLSPEEVDFAQPIRVVTNGALSFEGRVEPSASSLLRWAVVDDDRTMLFGADALVDVDAQAHRQTSGGQE
jgi:predicted esterase